MVVGGWGGLGEGAGFFGDVQDHILTTQPHVLCGVGSPAELA